MHGFDRPDAHKPHADAYQAVYDESLMIEGALRDTGAFTPRDTRTSGPSKMSREQRLAALDDGSRHDNGDS